MNEKPETKMWPKMKKKTVCRLTQKQHIQSDDFKNEFRSIQIRALNAVPFLLTESQSHGSCTISTQSLFTLFVQLLISKRYGNFIVFVSFFLFYFFNAAFLWLRPLDLVRFDFYSYRYRHIVWFMSCVHWFACVHIFSSFRTVIFVVSLNDCGRFSYLLAWHSFDQIFGITKFFFSSMIIIYGLSVMLILCFAVVSAVAEHKICMPNWPRYRYRYVYAPANFNLIVFLFSFEKLVWISHHIIIIIGDYFLNYNHRNFSDNICKQNHMVVAFDFFFYD